LGSYITDNAKCPKCKQKKAIAEFFNNGEEVGECQNCGYHYGLFWRDGKLVMDKNYKPNFIEIPISELRPINELIDKFQK